jgi:GntR family transcriptional repressor for pyruvate dehydrogenase complex
MSGAVSSIEPRAWEFVLSSIESDLLRGALQPGDHLPPERQLASDLGVGRSSVREALRALEVLGLVRTGTGSGPNAGAIIVATPSGGMSALMRLQVAASGFAVADVVRTRIILESAVAVQLAESAPGELPVARRLLDAMDAADLTPAEFLAIDQEFHRSLADAAGNQVVVATMAGLRSAIEGYVTAGLPRIGDWDATSQRLRNEHRSILRAIESGYTHSIRGLIHDHIDGYYREVQGDQPW